ncbi:pilus assembly FimT family protein [Jatrophihabitans fulvus]
MLSRVRRIRRETPDAGVSLTELIVTMTLMSIVGAMALGWMVGSTTATGRTTESSIDTARARTAVDTWSSMLGVMSPVATPGGRELAVDSDTIKFLAQLNSKPSSCATSCTTAAATEVTLGIDDATGDLVQVITRADSEDRLVLVPAESSPRAQGPCLFSFHRADGSLLSSGGNTPKCTGLTAAELDSVARVDFAFVLTPHGDSAQTYGTSVALPGSGT